MLKKNCPICEKNEDSKIIYSSNLPKDNNLIDFSGRKKPDGFHYQMNRCGKCDLLYAKEIYEENFSDELYKKSEFDYDEEIDGLKKTYSNCLIEACNGLENKNNFLEIGCGNGFMLEEALKIGFKNIIGVEPSIKAYEKSKSNIKDKIKQKPFDVNDFEDNYFDIIFIAMIVEHVVDINKFLKDIFQILKPGGKVVCICHNEKHFLSKILKNKHPIINDEHVVVFGKKSLDKIFAKHDFKNIKISELKNFYTLKYWLNMLPIKLALKSILKIIIDFLGFKKNIVGIKAGNIYLIAGK